MSLTQYATHSTELFNNSRFIRSYAKINLALEILGQRPDTYHELVTVMQTIDLYDTICLTATQDGSVHVICSRPELNNDDNLTVRAVQAVRQRLALSQGVIIELDKRIPVAAGLGGGSSNAAAVLLALQQWWRLPLLPADLLAIAATLGADVPFFLTGGLALCEGRGEKVTPLTPHWPESMRWLLLVKPNISISTGAVFRHLPPSEYTDGSHTRNVQNALDHGKEPQYADVYNGLEHTVLEHYPEVLQVRDAILQAGASFVRLSGSGSTLFSPLSNLKQAAQVRQRLYNQGFEVYLSRAVYPEDTYKQLL